jgi:type IV secretory pathway VirB10-like protein
MDDQMSPDSSPGEVSKKVGVRRVNNMPVYIVGGVMTVFLLVMVLVASDRAAKQNAPAEVKQEKATNTSMFAKAITGDQTDGIIQPQASSPPEVPDLSPAPDKNGPTKDGAAKGGSVPIARPGPGNLDAPPRPPMPTQNQQLQPPRDDERDRMRIAKLQQFEEAAKAKTSVPQFTATRNGGSSNVFNGTPTTRDETLARLAAVRQQIDSSTRDDPTAAYKARLQQIQASGLIGGGDTGASSAAPKLLQTAASGRNDIGLFAGAAQPDRWKLDSQPEAPRTPYELRAGFVIPAMMISGINSELPGQIMAQVSQNIYDTATGKWRLIPQGSRLVGRYSNDVTFAQARILIAWQRIVFPDGKAMDIGSMPGADSAGYSGFTDQVNNHYFRLFSSAFLLSGVTAGVAMSQPQTSAGSTPTAGSAMSEALGQQLGQVTAQLISKNMNVAPTLEIRPGYRFNVVVTKDLTFAKPFQSFDY